MVEATDAAADWNVIVTLPEATFREARKFIRRWGEVMAETILVIAFPALERGRRGLAVENAARGPRWIPHIKCRKTLEQLSQDGLSRTARRDHDGAARVMTGAEGVRQ
jgi:hypothetical protein